MRKILCICLSIICLLAMSGCNKNVDMENTDPPEINETIPQKEEPIYDYVVPDINHDYMELHPEVPIDTFVWEKPYRTLQTNSVLFDKNWSDGIVINGVFVSATERTDISSLNNHFFKDPSYADLQTGYYVNMKSMCQSTPFVKVSSFNEMYMHVFCTTGNQNLFIDKVSIVCNSNIAEGGLDELQKINRDFDEGCFGIGSNYDYIVSILGQPDSVEESVQEDGVYVSVIYNTDISSLNLVFSADQHKKNVLLTTIEWTPRQLQFELFSQDKSYWNNVDPDTEEHNYYVEDTQTSEE